MSNTHLKQRVIDIIEGEQATQHEKLNLLLQYVLDIEDNQTKIRKDVNSNPLGWVPIKWRSRVAGFFGFWMVWVSVNVAGYEITIPAIIEAIRPYIP